MTTYRFSSVQKCSSWKCYLIFIFENGYQVIADDVTVSFW